MLAVRKTTAIIVSIIIVLASGFATLVILQANKNPNDITHTVAAVSKHYLVPDEEPAIATVEDKEKVQSEFFRAAENGDKLLIYKEAKKVILYRPSVDKIVEVGPVSLAPVSTSSQ